MAPHGSKDNSAGPQAQQDQTQTLLVCDNLEPKDYPLCINELRGKPHGGDTWAKRAAKIDEMEAEMQAQLDRLKESGLE